MLLSPEEARTGQRAGILFWCLVIILHGLLMGSLWPRQKTEAILLRDAIGVDPMVTVDLRTDPLPQLLLVSGIGPGLAGRIIEARQQRVMEKRPPFPCRCVVSRVPGVPDRALFEAGPWLLPRPCAQWICENPETDVPRQETLTEDTDRRH